MLDVTVIDEAAAAEATLDPTRTALLAALAAPNSASGLAEFMELPRQKINYHLRILEEHGLIELIEERRKGNCTERILQATAASYLISPLALAAVAPDPRYRPDRLSARWLLALAGQLVRDLGHLLSASARAGQRLATFAVDGEVRFASATDRAEFTERLAAAVTDLVARYHDESAPRGRSYRLVLGLHPTVKEHTVKDGYADPRREL